MEKNKIIKVDFSSSKVTPAQVEEVFEEVMQRLKKLYREEKFNDLPGSDCITDAEIKSYAFVEPEFYNTRKGRKIYDHLFSCDRCRIRIYYLMGEAGKKYLGL